MIELQAATGMRPGEVSNLRPCDIERGEKKAGVDHWFPNQLRHTAAIDVREALGIEAAQSLLGHSRIPDAPVIEDVNTVLGRLLHNWGQGN